MLSHIPDVSIRLANIGYFVNVSILPVHTCVSVAYLFGWFFLQHTLASTSTVTGENWCLDGMSGWCFKEIQSITITLLSG